MRTDYDLQFLQYCENEDLRTLCDILTHDNKGRVRLNEQLMNKDSYIASYPDNMDGMWEDIASELQRFGGNTILNFFHHGHGPSYESIVEDVCRTMKVPYGEHDTAEEMEKNLLLSLTEKMLMDMSQEELEQMILDLNIKDFNLNKQIAAGSILLLARVSRGWFVKIFDYIIRQVSQRLLGRGIIQLGGQVGKRSVGAILGPIAWVALSAWTVWDIAGPAYRVVVPAIIQVAYMRNKHNVQSTNAESNAC